MKFKDFEKFSKKRIKMKKIFRILCAFVVAFLVSACGENYDFSLNSEFGKVSLKDFAGKKLIVYFGYTFCPDVCPATLALVSSELKSLENDKAYLLFISLDPERDSDINATNEWLRYFYPNATALIADDEKALSQVAKRYGAIYEKVPLPNSAMIYSVAHSNELYLFDERGKFVEKINDFSQTNLHERLKNFLNSGK